MSPATLRTPVRFTASCELMEEHSVLLGFPENTGASGVDEEAAPSEYGGGPSTAGAW